MNLKKEAAIKSESQIVTPKTTMRKQRNGKYMYTKQKFYFFRNPSFTKDQENRVRAEERKNCMMMKRKHTWDHGVERRGVG